MKNIKKKPSAVRETFPAPIVASGPTLFHPEFRAYTQGRMPFPHEIDFDDAEPGDTITIEIPEWLAEDRGLI